ncbi:MAG TPA: ABC transporter ATP-binding protein [Spirochaetia bacterium]|nr:ABC transporter ATP-binding protein [Spirochaetia bacterium]
MSDNALLRADHLTRVYTLGRIFAGQKIVAVNDASFVLPADSPQVFTLAGESGSGKTTIAKMILGFVEPSQGSISYKGADITRIRGRAQRMQFMREIQPVFQNPFETFNPLKKVENYLFETAVNFGMAPSRSAARRPVQAALERVGLNLDAVLGKYPNEFSGGQLQRISVARSLITNPSVLIADEPVSMVDASLRMSIVNLFKELRAEHRVSVVYITHDLATAYYVSDRIAIMLRGTIVEIGDVEKVLDHPEHPYTRILKESVPEPDPALKWNQDIAMADGEQAEYRLAACKFAGRCPHVMEVCRAVEPPLAEHDGRLVRCHLYSGGVTGARA